MARYIEQLKIKFKDKQAELLFLTMIAVVLLFLQDTDYFLPLLRLNVLLSTFIIYGVAIFLLDISPPVTAVLGVVCLLLSFPVIVIHYVSWAERISLYAYGFFILSSLQAMFSYVNKHKLWY